jgi:hypothetical protein
MTEVGIWATTAVDLDSFPLLVISEGRFSDIRAVSDVQAAFSRNFNISEMETNSISNKLRLLWRDNVIFLLLLIT